MRRLHDLWRRGRREARAATSDAELLDRFTRDGDHAAFAELVDRLGPLVYGACRRLLPNSADVEDAFQATFLVLVRRAGTLAGRPLGPWLHRVAVWTARNFRRRATRAAARPLDEPILPCTLPATDAVDVRLDIDAAVSALPEKYRAPVILCHLQGWTRRELAAHLGCPESTASSLVGRGLAKLRKRLAGREPAAVLAIAGSVSVPPALASAVVRAACLYRTSSLAAAASPAVAELTEGVLRMFGMKKWATALAAAVAMVGLGFGLVVGSGQRVEAQTPKPSQSADDLKLQRAKLDKEIAAAKERIEDLEAQKDQVTRLEMLNEYARLLNARKEALTEPYIGVWVRSPNAEGQMGALSGRAATAQQLLLLSRDEQGGWRSEFAINEIHGKGKLVVEAHFYDVRSLQTYLTRAGKDPAAPKKLKLYIDKSYPWEKAKTVIDACKTAGFVTVELASAPLKPDGSAPASAKLPAEYAIEPPDVLRIEATLKDGDKSVAQTDATGQFVVRPDGTVSLGNFGSVKVAGLSPLAATDAVRKHLAGLLAHRGPTSRSETLEVSLDVAAYNSKRYYVIIAEPGKGKEVFAFPCIGSETILDAIAGVPGLANRLPKANVNLTRKKGADGEAFEVLPIDWPAITQHGITTTNYQLLPGDRLYVGQTK